MSKTRNFAEVIRRKLAKNPALAAAVEREARNAHIAEQIYNYRTAANLTQTQLAEKVGTQQSVIARLEDAEYDGHSLSILNRIADALDLRIRVEFYAKCNLKAVYDEVVQTDASEWKKTAQWQPSVTVSRPKVKVG